MNTMKTVKRTGWFALSIALILLFFVPTDAPAFPFDMLVFCANSIDHATSTHHSRKQKQLVWTIPRGSRYVRRDPIDQEIYGRSTNEVHGASCFAVGILPGVGFPAENWDVFLLRVNLPAGRHRSVSYIDVGLAANEVDGQSLGLQLSGVWNRNLGSPGQFQIAGAANLCDGDFDGWQCGGLFNLSTRSFDGWQCAGLLNRVGGDFDGWQCAGLANLAGGGVEGLQTGLVNVAERMDGAQLGLANFAQSGSGVQIGVFNWTRSFTGIQIGAGNCIVDSPIPFFPLVNASF